MGSPARILNEVVADSSKDRKLNESPEKKAEKKSHEVGI
ncbi:hypothetical protein EVB94_218 [Rhizobium phage RHph_TM40]|nr:hypothetical protein EVB94_218 [Rhizobium phage RHph_TM40]QIG72052.1 hypothetical protein EVB95_218 [Rhizobium phage RHph_TM2_3B]QIG77805.1 hypothetical protein EVB64_218 [Rhizobium phage RHph_TM61]